MLKRFLIPVVIIFAVLGIFISGFLPGVVKDAMLDTAIGDAENTVNQFKVIRGYYTKNVIVKAKAFGMKPHFDHAEDPERIPLPATMIHDLSRLLKENGTNMDLYSPFPFPNRSSRRLDDFQKEAWDVLNQNPEEVFVKQVENNGEYFLRIAIADTMQAQACVNCHNTHPMTPKNDWELGQVRGILEVNKPLNDIYAAAASTRMHITWISSLTLIIVAGLIIYLFRQLVTSRTDKLATAISDLADGRADLTSRLTVGTRDEIGSVAEYLNSFLDTFSGIIGRVKEGSGAVGDSANKVKSAANEIVNKVREQEDQTNLIATAVNEFSSNIKEISGNTEQARINTRAADENLQESTQKMVGSVNTIKKLDENMIATGKSIARLREQSDQIGSVLDVIKSIAEQTNLLALNAAIEAARAGEQGRGFAVVADEVRALAHRTQESITEIQETVVSLQSMAEEAENSVSSNCEQTALAQQDISAVSDHLGHVIEMESAVLQAVEGIAEALTQQSDVSDEVDRQVVMLKDLSAGSLEEVNRIVEQLDYVCTHTEELVSEVSDFKM